MNSSTIFVGMQNKQKESNALSLTSLKHKNFKSRAKASKIIIKRVFGKIPTKF